MYNNYFNNNRFYSYNSKNVDNFATLIKEDVTVVTFFDNSLTKEQEEEIITKLKQLKMLMFLHVSIPQNKT